MKKQKSMQEMWKNSYLADGNNQYLENLYENYLEDPDSISPDWRSYFNTIAENSSDVSHTDIQNYFLQLSKNPAHNTGSSNGAQNYLPKQEKVINLISAYRAMGHLLANIDPLGLYKGTVNPTLNLDYYGFTEKDLDTLFDVGTFKAIKKDTASLKEIHQTLQKTYCGTLGIEYMHISRSEEVHWLQQQMEEVWPSYTLTKEEKLKLLDRLIVADGLEKYLGNRYVGQKRFSLEGGDALVPLLEKIIHRGREQGIKEAVIGMAHRGRLNVLVNVLGKETAKVFANFEGKDIDTTTSGDVKYHMGFSSNVKTKSGSVHVALAFNPSHLEIVSPVVQGSVRCRQRRRKDKQYNQVIPIQLHGDAAFAGQGIVMETFCMSQTRWFTVGGSVHIVINNQVGFTTSNPLDSRSSLYCTDPAKMIEAPVIHINANDPEAVLFAAQLAIDYRNKFKRDIVIDLVCYRRHGHNEADEPSATQPIMYKVIKAMPTPAAIYAKKLLSENLIDENAEIKLFENYRDQLDAGKSVVELENDKNAYEFSSEWDKFLNQKWTAAGDTKIPLKKLKELAKTLENLPDGFVVQPQVKKTLDSRSKMTLGEVPVNWGYAENLAYATLLDEGYPIRLCGEDSGRGTFAHRHASLYDQNTGGIYIPLSHVSEKQAQINIIDSLLSEEGVLAFEYGYACTEPNNLVLWEAQFGDFANGAQVVIDQFISSGEQKWGRLCGLVMLLPHGYEGQGPEHSSARLERYLQLCAQDNMQVCVPTTPAQVYHMLRRQMIRPYRKPLIVMTPKSLLRHPLAVSTMEDLASGEFKNVIQDVDLQDAGPIDRVVLCCGKVYYDLYEKRQELKLHNVAIIRVEQLYPFPKKELAEALAPYKKAKDFIWCQEEPENQGAWYSTQYDLRKCLGTNHALVYAGRPGAAAPAVGYGSVHAKEQKQLVMQALTQ